MLLEPKEEIILSSAFEMKDMTVLPAHRKKNIIPIFRTLFLFSVSTLLSPSRVFFDCLPCARHFASTGCTIMSSG